MVLKITFAAACWVFPSKNPKSGQNPTTIESFLKLLGHFRPLAPLRVVFGVLAGQKADPLGSAFWQEPPSFREKAPFSSLYFPIFQNRKIKIPDHVKMTRARIPDRSKRSRRGQVTRPGKIRLWKIQSWPDLARPGPNPDPGPGPKIPAIGLYPGKVKFRLSENLTKAVKTHFYGGGSILTLKNEGQKRPKSKANFAALLQVFSAPFLVPPQRRDQKISVVACALKNYT